MKKAYRKINFIKLIALLAISFIFSPLSCNAVKVKEAMLLSDLAEPGINDSHIRRNSRWISDAEVYTFQDDTVFERLFPTCPHASVLDAPTGEDIINTNEDLRNKSFFVGQITTSSGSGVGTVTLLDVIPGWTEDSIRVIGITAMHNFVGFTDTGVVVHPKFSRKFFIGAKTLPDGSGITNYGEVDIDRVLVQANPSKDVCFFEGSVTPNRALLSSNEIMAEIFSLEKPTLIAQELSVGSRRCVMYHYPLGKKNQRVNTGEAFHHEGHQIRSLFGSSGSSIFDETSFEVIGIHDGVKSADLEHKVIEVTNGDLPVARYNSFVKVSQGDYDSIRRDRVDLYDGSITKDFIDALSVFVESNSKE